MIAQHTEREVSGRFPDAEFAAGAPTAAWSAAVRFARAIGGRTLVSLAEDASVGRSTPSSFFEIPVQGPTG